MRVRKPVSFSFDDFLNQKGIEVLFSIMLPRPYNARMSREDGRRRACEAEAPEGTWRWPCASKDGDRPPAVGSIRLLYDEAQDINRGSSSFVQ
jgi:hypothetical protein